MYLVQPSLLISDATVPKVAIRVYAQMLCDDFAHWSGFPRLHVVVTNDILFKDVLWKSPSDKWARLINTELFLALGVSNALQLQFVIAHALAHLIPNVAEWECDLMALDWINYFDTPFCESTACAIARTTTWRVKALRFLSGQRAVAIGDALTNGAWIDSISQVADFSDPANRMHTS